MITVDEAEALSRSWESKLIPPARARALTNRFILEHLRDGFGAGAPRYLVVENQPAWAVSILCQRGTDQPLEVGEVLIHALNADFVGYTPPAEVYRRARSGTP
jgi:hypothetical protein